jgi:hypothetical protein
LAQLALPLPACAGDVLEADCLASELRADGAADEALIPENPDLGEVARVVADCDRLADEGRECRIDVAQALEPYSVALHPAGPSDGQQEKVELLQ